LGVSFAALVGPVGLELVRRGLRHGFAHALIFCLGVVAADTTYLSLTYIGLSSFLNLAVVKTTIWFFGVAWIVWRSDR